MKPKVLLPFLLLALGVACAGLLFAVAPSTERSAPPERVALVEVIAAQPADRRASVQATGLVEAARQVVVMPQVAGRIVEVADAVVPGGRLAAGERMARIDPRDFELAVAVEASRVAQAELELALERGRQEVAVREWELLGGAAGDTDGALARREPHLETSRRALEAARSGLARARLDLERTTLVAPFDAMVVSENLDVGQVVGPTSQVATLIGTDRFHVRAALPIDRVGMIDVGPEGSLARVIQRLADGRVLTREGRVTQLLPELEPQTRRAQVLVSIEAPLEGEGLPILPGAYVEIAIEGRMLRDTFLLPRTALADGRQVWVVTDQDRLASREVHVVWAQEHDVVVSGGLAPGDRVVTSPLALPIEGMPVRVSGEASNGREASL